MPRPARFASSPLADHAQISKLRADRGTSLAAQAYESIRELLFRGVFQQGEALRMDVLCDRLGASKQPIADALKRLAHEGYLTIVPQVGCHVRCYGHDEVRDYYRLYAATEGLLAELAAQRATPDQLASLRTVSASIEALIATQDTAEPEARRYRKLNREFHRRVREAAASWLVAEGAEAMHDRSDFFTVTMRHSFQTDRVRLAHKEHEALLAALTAQDSRAAREAMEWHVLSVGARLWNLDLNKD
jgi:DNA-binding GntR family transcriptional regulator